MKTLNNEEWQQKLDDLGPCASIDNLSCLVNQAGSDVPVIDVFMVKGVIADKLVDEPC